MIKLTPKDTVFQFVLGLPEVRADRLIEYLEGVEERIDALQVKVDKYEAILNKPVAFFTTEAEAQEEEKLRRREAEAHKEENVRYWQALRKVEDLLRVNLPAEALKIVERALQANGEKGDE